MNSESISGTQSGMYLWTILICVKKEAGYGSFSTLMPYPPTEGRTLEFYDTPEGSFSGKIIRVHEAVKFASCEKIKSKVSFGLTREISVTPVIIEFQVWVDVKSSSELTKFGIPLL